MALQQYSTTEVASWASTIGLSSQAARFEEEGIDGSRLMSMTKQDLMTCVGLTGLQANMVLRARDRPAPVATPVAQPSTVVSNVTMQPQHMVNPLPVAQPVSAYPSQPIPQTTTINLPKHSPTLVYGQQPASQVHQPQQTTYACSPVGTPVTNQYQQQQQMMYAQQQQHQQQQYKQQQMANAMTTGGYYYNPSYVMQQQRQQQQHHNDSPYGSTTDDPAVMQQVMLAAARNQYRGDPRYDQRTGNCWRHNRWECLACNNNYCLEHGRQGCQRCRERRQRHNRNTAIKFGLKMCY